MALPGTLEWLKKWYTDRAFGICRNMAAGPLNEPEEEFREEMATCLALYHEAADVYLRRFDLSPKEIKEIKKYLDEKAREVFDYKTWDTAKYIAAHFKDIFRRTERELFP